MDNNIIIFNFIYNKVFNTNGTMKVCGRDLCMKLISVANTIDNSTNYGNLTTGMINIDNINILHNKLFT